MSPPILIPDHHPRCAARPLACAARARAVTAAARPPAVGLSYCLYGSRSVGSALRPRPLCGFPPPLVSIGPPRLRASSARGPVRCSPSAVLRLVCSCLCGSLRPAPLPFRSPSAGLRSNVCSCLCALLFRSSRGLRGCVASASLPRPCALRLADRSPSGALPRSFGPSALLGGSALLVRVAPSPASPPAAPLRAWLLASLPPLCPLGWARRFCAPPRPRRAPLSRLGSGSFVCLGFWVFVRLRRGASFGFGLASRVAGRPFCPAQGCLPRLEAPRHLGFLLFRRAGAAVIFHMRMSSNLGVPDNLLSVSPPLSIAGVIFTPI